MKKLKFKLSGFEIGMIIAFVIVGLLGGAAWWYLSGNLTDIQAQCADVKSRYVASSIAKVDGGIVVSPGNLAKLNENMELLQKQIDPVISGHLHPKNAGLDTATGKEDSVSWKRGLDDDVGELTKGAHANNIVLPRNFYFGFSRYVTESPSDSATEVLNKQKAGIKEIASILINAPVKAITAFRRSYEEDPHSGGATSGEAPSDKGAGDVVPGYAASGPNGLYTAYPFEIEFDATAEELRPVINGLVNSPYVFVIRRVEAHNEQLTSRVVGDLDHMAGATPGASSVVASDPGQVAASTPTIGPQYLFGHSLIHVRIRLDMIEWNPAVPNADAYGKPPGKK
jgi:hypothetical protein